MNVVFNRLENMDNQNSLFHKASTRTKNILDYINPSISYSCFLLFIISDNQILDSIVMPHKSCNMDCLKIASNLSKTMKLFGNIW
jgi:hypothetical protein